MQYPRYCGTRFINFFAVKEGAGGVEVVLCMTVGVFGEGLYWGPGPYCIGLTKAPCINDSYSMVVN